MNCCTFTPSKLEEALVLSGENRCELEKVLKHYSACDDSLKLKAAEFLIENMPGHYTLRGKTIDHYREIIDKDSISSYYYKKILDISLSHFVSSGEDSQIQEDLRYITSDFLIRHIDLSFELLYKYSWLDMIAFDEFLEYVLPYRFENERLDLWRDSLHVYASNMPSEKVGDYFTNSLSGLIAKFKLKESTQMNLQIRRTLLDINSLGDCYLNAQNNLFEQRSLGIPAMIDYIPCYANRNGYHYWCNEPSVLFNKNHLELVFDRKPGKIYRKTFLKNILNTMQTCYKMVDKENPTLTIGYVSCPHPPFVINEEGGAVDYRNTSNWADKSLYLNQLKYVNACMENAVDGILQNDRNAIIIIQSDHGVRYPYHMMECYGTPEYDATIETPYMQNILNCVYYQGKEMDIEGKSGINTLRIVLNEIFMTNYEMLDNPEKYLYQYK